MLAKNYTLFKEKLKSFLSIEQILEDPIYLRAYASDASFYSLIPKLVLSVHHLEQMSLVIKWADIYQIPLTFRAAGTSLSGQAVTQGVLVLATKGWTDVKVWENATKITSSVGVTGAKLNAILKSFGRKIGPDPASINAAMIGGIAANNASGMCCGIEANTYQTLCDMTLVFRDGTILDTSCPTSKAEFTASHRDIILPIIALRDQIAADNELTELIKHKYKIKNTMGYSINAFVDYSDPIDIIKHLIVGSEGTLAFIASITLKTLENFSHKSCALIFYKNIQQACEVLPRLKTCGVSAVELLDRKSISSVDNHPLCPDYFKTLGKTTAGLLVEIQGNSQQVVEQKIADLRQKIANYPTELPYEFTSDQKTYNFYWSIRKGLLPSVGAMRQTGTTCIIEDVAFPIEHLAQGATAIVDLFEELGYKDAVLFGHALQGNLHLVFSADFTQQTHINQYGLLMQKLAVLVVEQFNGSLKAEHGTGRNMAPFVELQWGEKAYRIMQQIKTIFDPNNIVNPGVIINANKSVHLEKLKQTPGVDPLIDKCMECGFCEPLCVSNQFTLSPRQRIVIAREIATLQQNKTNPYLLKSLTQSAQYHSTDSCATDGLCALGCPVDIDTGKYVKKVREHAISTKGQTNALKIARNFALLAKLTRGSLHVATWSNKLLSDKTLVGLTKFSRNTLSKALPLYTSALPRATQTKLTEVQHNQPDLENTVVYFSSCINRTMGKSKDYDPTDKDLIATFIEVLQRANYQVIIPDNLEQLCCSMPFSSKGYTQGAHFKIQELYQALRISSKNGALPIVFDMSPCFSTFVHYAKAKGLQLYDPIEFSTKYLLPNLKIVQREPLLNVFPVCSVKKDNLEHKLLELCHHLAHKVNYIQSNCCGFAGDKGFMLPELNQHGTQDIKAQLSHNTAQGFSTSRTCEIGLTTYTGASFKHIIYALEKATKQH